MWTSLTALCIPSESSSVEASFTAAAPDDLHSPGVVHNQGDKPRFAQKTKLLASPIPTRDTENQYNILSEPKGRFFGAKRLVYRL